MAPLELAQQQRQHRLARAGRRAELEAPAQLASPSSAATSSSELLLEREQPLRAAVEPQPRLGRLDAPPRAVEQLRAEPLLERPDLQADRRLRHAEPLRRLREAAALDDRAERGQLTRVHKQSLCDGAPDVPTGIGQVPDSETLGRGHAHPRLPALAPRDAERAPTRRRAPRARRRCSRGSSCCSRSPLIAIIAALILPLTSGGRSSTAASASAAAAASSRC